MERTALSRVGLVLVAALLLLFGDIRPVLAQNKQVEAQARHLQKKAMEEDYLVTDFTKAQDKLNQAIAKCGTERCGAALRAQLKRDLGVVQISSGQVSKDEAAKNFAEAMQLDPSLQLDPDLKTREIEEVWEKAKRGGGAGAGSSGGGGGAPPSGDFQHAPAAMQLVRTPIPIYAEYSGSEAVVKVIARYKAFGMTEWKSQELRKMGKGWGGLIPCIDVLQGEVLYYLQGFNQQNEPIATSGDRNHPYKVSIKRDKIDGESPHLPDQPAPAQCAEAGDCPPDFPGCHSGSTSSDEVKGKGEDADCEENSECESAQCKNNRCTKPEDKASGNYRRVWLGVSAGAEITFVGSASDVCKLAVPQATPLNDGGYYCVNSGGADYPNRTGDPGANNAIDQTRGDKISGGPAFGNVRLLLSIDVALSGNLMVGARAGLILNKYPGQAAYDEAKGSAVPPLHAELRGLYVFGRAPLAKAGAAGYVTVFGGYGETSTRVPVKVYETNIVGSKTYDAWAMGGPLFFGAGGGLRAAFSRRAALLVGPSLRLALGNGLGVFPGIGLDVGMQFGL